MPPYIGEFEELVLLAAMSLSPDVHATEMLDHIVDTTGRNSSLGSLYRTLSRLTEKNLLQSRLGDASSHRGGKRKRLYSVTTEGVAAAQEALLARRRLWGSIPSALLPNG